MGGTRVVSPGRPSFDQTLAVCRDVDAEAFFPAGHDKTDPVAVAACRRCPVRAACLGWALGHNERFGIWGGTTPKQRRRIQQSRAAIKDPTAEWRTCITPDCTEEFLATRADRVRCSDGCRDRYASRIRRARERAEAGA